MKRVGSMVALAFVLAIGALGIGVFLGDLWLVDRTSDGLTAKPAIAWAPEREAYRTRCPVDLHLPRTVEELAREIRATPAGDTATTVRTLARCTVDHAAWATFVRMLIGTARLGDHLAAQALDVLAHDACVSVALLAGSDGPDRACVDAIATTGAWSEGATPPARELAHAAELHALIEAGVGTPSLQAAFCAAMLAADNGKRMPAHAAVLTATYAATCLLRAGDGGTSVPNAGQ